MSEHDHDGFYWEPSAQDDLRQGDLLFNVPIALMPQRPRFVLGPGEDVKTEPYDDYPENAPSDQIVVEAVFGALAMVVTPTCHIAEGEKDQEIIAVVPVQPLNLVIPSIAELDMCWPATTCRYTCFRCGARSVGPAFSGSTASRYSIGQRRC
jgi:hypothetical protein